MQLKDGDFIGTADTEDQAIELTAFCNRQIKHALRHDELEAYYKVWVLNQHPRTNKTVATWAVLVRHKERESNGSSHNTSL